MSASARLNLLIPLEIMIEIERESEKRGMKTPQFVREAIHEKLRKTSNTGTSEDFTNLKEEIRKLREDIDSMKSVILKSLVG